MTTAAIRSALLFGIVKSYEFDFISYKKYKKEKEKNIILIIKKTRFTYYIYG